MYSSTHLVTLSSVLIFLACATSAYGVLCNPGDTSTITLNCNIPTDYLAIGDSVFVNVSVPAHPSETFEFLSTDYGYNNMFNFPVTQGVGYLSFTFNTPGNQEWFVSDSNDNYITEVHTKVVSAAFPTSLVLSASTTVVAGVPFSVNVTALNGTNPLTTFGRKIYWQITDTRAQYTAYTTFSNGLGINAMTLYQAGVQTIAAYVTFNGTTTVYSSNLQINVVPGVPHSLVNASYPSILRVGVPSIFTFAVVDVGGNPVLSFNQTVNATRPDSNLVSGTPVVRTVSGIVYVDIPVTFYQINTNPITFSAPGLADTSLTVQVHPGYITGLTVNLIDNTFTAGSAISMYVGGVDMMSDSVEYVADVLTINCPGSPNVVAYNVTPTNFNFPVQTAGTNLPLTVVAHSSGFTDVVYHRNITVIPGQANKILMSPINSTLNQGAVVPINVSVYDAYMNPVQSSEYSNYQASINCSLNGESTFFQIPLTHGVGKGTVQFAQSGKWIVSAYVGYVESDTQSVTVISTTTTGNGGTASGSITGSSSGSSASSGSSSSCDINAEEACSLSMVSCANSTSEIQICKCYGEIINCFKNANCITGQLYTSMYDACVQTCGASACTPSSASSGKAGSSSSASLLMATTSSVCIALFGLLSVFVLML